MRPGTLAQHPTWCPHGQEERAGSTREGQLQLVDSRVRGRRWASRHPAWKSASCPGPSRDVWHSTKVPQGQTLKLNIGSETKREEDTDGVGGCLARRPSPPSSGCPASNPLMSSLPAGTACHTLLGTKPAAVTVQFGGLLPDAHSKAPGTGAEAREGGREPRFGPDSRDRWPLNSSLGMSEAPCLRLRQSWPRSPETLEPALPHPCS